MKQIRSCFSSKKPKGVQSKRDGREMVEIMGKKMRESLEKIEIEWGESRISPPMS
jgi:hypothetical protein